MGVCCECACSSGETGAAARLPAPQPSLAPPAASPLLTHQAGRGFRAEQAQVQQPRVVPRPARHAALHGARAGLEPEPGAWRLQPRPPPRPPWRVAAPGAAAAAGGQAPPAALWADRHACLRPAPQQTGGGGEGFGPACQMLEPAGGRRQGSGSATCQPAGHTCTCTLPARASLRGAPSRLLPAHHAPCVAPPPPPPPHVPLSSHGLIAPPPPRPPLLVSRCLRSATCGRWAL